MCLTPKAIYTKQQFKFFKMKIPLVDLKAQHDSIRPDLDQAIKEINDNSQFIMGKPVEEFENSWAKYCNSKHAIACANGTVAVEMALKAVGVKSGDEVITVPNTFIATTASITNCQAKVKFVDVDETTLLIDPEKIEQAITSKTKAIIAVHLYGQMCEMERIREIADKNNLKIIEDAAQAHGAEFKGKPVGYFGDAATFSFFPAKILGAMGDAGAVITNNDETAKKLRLLVNQGRITKYEHIIESHNYRMDALQAKILSVKLTNLDKWVNKRRELSKIYNEKLKGIIQPPIEKENCKHVYYMYVIRTKNRDKLMEKLKKKDIACGIHYPIPLHLQPAYKYLNHKKGDFPVLEKAAKEILSIPLYPELTYEQQNYVIQSIRGNLE